MSVGPLTPQEALSLYGSFRLAAHIEVYRKLGYNIRTETVYDNHREYARYHYLGHHNG